MRGQTRKMTDDEIISIFRQTKRTAAYTVLGIKYVHYEDDINHDHYEVSTDCGKYYFCRTMTSQHNYRCMPRVYNRIFRI